MAAGSAGRLSTSQPRGLRHAHSGFYACRCWKGLPDAEAMRFARLRPEQKGLCGECKDHSGNAVSGTRTLTLPARPLSRVAREARVELRFGAMEIRRSPNEKDRSLTKTGV
jgi:hypothetical protein